MKHLLPVIIASLFFAVVTQVSAATLVLEQIGTSLYTTGATTWTYYGTNPVLQGSASPSAVVSLTIDGVQNSSATADTSGDWSMNTTTLDSVGSYELNLNSGADNILFTLSIASSSSTAGTKGGTDSGDLVLPGELPATGSEDILLLLGIGGLMLTAGVSAGFLLKE